MIPEMITQTTMITCMITQDSRTAAVPQRLSAAAASSSPAP